jgi:hypothetical protein
MVFIERSSGSRKSGVHRGNPCLAAISAALRKRDARTSARPRMLAERSVTAQTSGPSSLTDGRRCDIQRLILQIQNDVSLLAEAIQDTALAACDDLEKGLTPIESAARSDGDGSGFVSLPSEEMSSAIEAINRGGAEIMIALDACRGT